MGAASPVVLDADGREIKITRPEKVLFPESGITKGDLIRYYQRVAARMLPYLEGRPLTIERYPDGIGKEGFIQKAVSPYYPAWIRRARMQKTGGTITQAVCNDAATLVYLANQACIALHPWSSRVERPEYPDVMIFDLDPPGEETGAAVEAALVLKGVLDELKLPAYLKATGSRGLHAVVPLEGTQDFDTVRAFAREVAEILVERNPSQYTIEARKAKRGNRVYIDINRNAYAQTAVAVYSVRARRGAPVAIPIAWSELRKRGFRPDGCTIKSVFERLESIQDPWKDFGNNRVSVGKTRKHRAA